MNLRTICHASNAGVDLPSITTSMDTDGGGGSYPFAVSATGKSTATIKRTGDGGGTYPFAGSVEITVTIKR